MTLIGWRKDLMQIHEILDRFELLYPNNSVIMDLRRAFIDKDLHSIFRIVTSDNKEDLRKLVNEENYQSLWRLLEMYCDTRLVVSLKHFYNENIPIAEDCLSRGQIQSKLWIVKELNKLDVNLGTIFLCAGWYGTLATLLFESNSTIKKILSFDIDESCVKIAENFNAPWHQKDWKFKAITDDIMNVDYNEHHWQFWSKTNNRLSHPITDKPDTIINTSCEHLEDFNEWYGKIPKGKLLILQTNNYFDLPEHINCSKNLIDFAGQTPMTTVLYQGELYLDKYSRYMRIGVK